MSSLADDKVRTDLLNRLKRAEGQLRGVQRMIEEGQPCLEIVGQLTAVRKALESTCVRMTVGLIEQEFGARVAGERGQKHLTEVLGEVQILMGKLR